MTPIALPSSPRRILIIKPSAIGDVVHALPVLNLLHRRWPEARLSWLVTPACAGILERHPMLHEVIHFDRQAYARAWRSWKTTSWARCPSWWIWMASAAAARLRRVSNACSKQ